MFSGLIQATGKITEISNERLSLAIDAFPEDWEPIQLGESIAINGVCLTVVDLVKMSFDISEETIRRTSMSDWTRGTPINLERSLRLMDRLGGHMVQGHVDTVGEITAIEPKEDSVRFEFKVPAEFDRFLIDKGSVALDGISLTVVTPKDGEFECWIIPHTLQHTNLHAAKPGQKANVEFDVLAKHVEKLLASR